MLILQNSPSHRLSAALLIIFSLFSDCVLAGQSEKLWGTAFDIAVVEDKAYLCAAGHLLVLDVTNHRDLRLLGQIKISNRTPAVHVDGGLAFVAAGERGLRIIDVSDPSAMFEAGGIDTPRYAVGLHVEKDQAYVNSEGSWMGFDVADPRNPVSIPSLPIGFPDKIKMGQWREDNLVFLADNISLRILDRSDPDRDVEIGRCSLRPESGILGPSEIFVAGGRAYIGVEGGMYEYHLCIVDVFEPSRPTVMGICEISRNVENHLGKIRVSGDRAYITISFGGLLVIDVSDPAAPRIVGSFPTNGRTRRPPT